MEDQIISIPDLLTGSSITNTNGKPHNWYFQFRRALTLVLLALCAIIVYFQRLCPAVVASQLAAEYHVNTTELGVFTSVFYYPYSILQIFSGVLADVMEPSLLMGVSTIIGSIGAIIFGLSKSIFVGSIGRLLVGIGCAPIAVPLNRILMNWFHLQYFSRVFGIFFIFSNCGSFLAQTPLTLLSEVIGWRKCFYCISGISFALATLVILFVRGNPVSLGFSVINPSLAADLKHVSIRQRIRILFSTLRDIVTTPTFWNLAIFAFCENGAYFNLAGLWGEPFLRECLGFSSVKASNALMGLSLGMSFSSLLLPLLVEKVTKSKKWTMFGGLLFAIISCIPFIVMQGNMNFWLVLFLFIVISNTTVGLVPLFFPLSTEYFHPSKGASAIGFVNFFSFLSLIVFMPLTGKIIEKFGTVDGTDIHNPDGFKYGLWVLNICCLIIGAIALFFAKEPNQTAKEQETLVSSYNNLK